MLELVIGRPAPKRRFPRARLADARLVRLRDEAYPMLIEAPGACVPGLIVEGLIETDLDRIQFFESVEYETLTVEVELLEGGRVEAQAFASTAKAAHDDEDWRFEEWRARHKAQDLRETSLWMAFHGRFTVQEADRLWDEARAAGRPIEDLVREACGVQVPAGS